jgi:hypothetical protein
VSAGGAKQETPAVLFNSGGFGVSAQRLGECVMARHDMVLAAFLVQHDLPAGPDGLESQLRSSHQTKNVWHARA